MDALYSILSAIIDPLLHSYSHSLSTNLSSPRLIRFQLVVTRLVWVRRKYEGSLLSTTMDPLETLMVPGKIIISSKLRPKDDTTRFHPSSRDSQIPARYALAAVFVRFIADSRTEAGW